MQGFEWSVGLVDRAFNFWENLIAATLTLSTVCGLSYFVNVITLMSFMGATGQIYFDFFLPSML